MTAPAPIRLRADAPSVYTLRHALLVYDTLDSKEAFVTLHEILRKGRGPASLGPGEVASAERLAPLVRSLAGGSMAGAWVDPRVLYAAPGVVVWHSLARERTIHFECDDPRIGTAACRAHIPDLIFAATGRAWYVWACKATASQVVTHARSAIALYRAPFFNVWASGQICTGNVALPQPGADAKTLDAFEDAFYGSRFTHANVHGSKEKLVRWKGGAYALWSELIAGKHQRAIPHDALVPLKLTLGEVPKFITAEPA